jgi:hypothetical protein
MFGWVINSIQNLRMTLSRIFRFSVLIGPINHVKHLLSAERLPFSAIYFSSLGLTLYFSLSVSCIFSFEFYYYYYVILLNRHGRILGLWSVGLHRCVCQHQAPSSLNLLPGCCPNSLCDGLFPRRDANSAPRWFIGCAGSGKSSTTVVRRQGTTYSTIFDIGKFGYVHVARTFNWGLQYFQKLHNTRFVVMNVYTCYYL